MALARFSKTLVRAIVEKTQKPGLSIGREFANFVEEERAAFGLLDFAGDVGDRSCKRAPSMSKQSARHQVARQGRTVRRRKGSRGA